VTEFLMRFEDGPMAARDNISTIAGTSGNTVISCFGWPLPDRVGVLCHPGVANVAFWDADDIEAAGLPKEITDSPNTVIYRKISQSRLKSEMKGILRGALYRLEAR